MMLQVSFIQSPQNRALSNIKKLQIFVILLTHFESIHWRFWWLNQRAITESLTFSGEISLPLDGSHIHGRAGPSPAFKIFQYVV